MTTGLPSYWRLIPQRYNLIGTECENCGEKFFPPRKLCPTCRRKGRIREYKFSGEGEIFSYTVIYSPPEGFEKNKPYAIGIVKLNEGPMITGQIVDCSLEDVDIGKKVKAVFRRVMTSGSEGSIRYGYKFKLV